MQQVVDELYKPARKNFPRRRTILKGLNDLWQMDLAEFVPYAKTNKGYKYLLVVIDCFSKYLWTEPVKNKTGSEVTKAMNNILKRAAPNIPTNLQSDMGKEFYNSEFQRLTTEKKINHYSTFSTIKASMAERVIRTIKTNFYKLFSLRGKYVWIDTVKEITDRYNNKRHSTIKMTPIEAYKNEQHLLDTVYSNIKTVGNAKFKVGDVVRISKHKSVFDKGYKPSWTTELFKIIKVKKTYPITYLLEDMNGQSIAGGFYELELQKAKYDDVYLVEKVLKRKGNKLYVKWLGLDSSHNTWINKYDVVK